MSRAFAIVVALGAAGTAAGQATGPAKQENPGRYQGLRVVLKSVPTLRAEGRLPFVPRGTCPETIVSQTDANFQGGSFIAEAGLAEHEIAAASYVLPASAFPIKIDLMEMIFATSQATEQTVTQWSILVWDGTPATGTLVAEYSSDDVILPYIRLGPGTQGVNVQVSVDPDDPDQIFVNDDSGTHTFSIGYRVDHHNQQPANPCSAQPSQWTCCNAFPTVDVSGLQHASNNWLFGMDCGPFGCPANGGWASFAQLPFYCQPSGDWVMRATWESVNCQPAAGACCLPDGSCNINTQAACVAAGGVYQGDNTMCANVNCPQPTQACCFASTGGCVNLTPANCTAAGGTPAGPGTSCATFVCFPMGACCLPNGNCIGPVSPAACAAQGGTFHGNGSTCAQANCPLPMGACCFPNHFCLVLSQIDCANAGGTWGGLGTDCADHNGNGTSDFCEPHCACDWNNSGTLNSQDFFDFLTSFFNGSADFNHDNMTNSQDFFDFLTCFFSGC